MNYYFLADPVFMKHTEHLLSKARHIQFVASEASGSTISASSEDSDADCSILTRPFPASGTV
jgi:hypothetical protein